MTGNATFGELWRLAAEQLRPPIEPVTGDPSPEHDIRATAAALHRMITAVAGYLDDPLWQAQGRRFGPWGRAFTEARRAAHHAGQISGQGLSDAMSKPRDGTLAARLDAAARSLTAARDLLHTHFGPSPAGADYTAAPVPRSDWAEVITSGPVTRALLATVAGQARDAAGQALTLTLPSQAGKRVTARWRRIPHACTWLQALDAAVQAAQLQESVTDSDLRLLYAIPVHDVPDRQLPAAAAPVAALSAGVVTAADRACREERGLGPQVQWTPDMNAAALRRAAAACVMTCFHCEVILTSLAPAAAGAGYAELPGVLDDATAAAGAARSEWLAVARAWDQMTTDYSGFPSEATTDIEDLGLWTGRLAYADPSWTPAHGRAADLRPSAELGGDRAAITGTVTAAHYATRSVYRFAAAGHAQVVAAAAARRLYVPTRLLPESYNIPHRIANAPAGHVDALLKRYDGAGRASGRALETVADVAERVGAPSHVLTAAARATGRSPAKITPGNDLLLQTLQQMGVTDPDLLHRASALSRQAGLLLEEGRTRGARRYAINSRQALPARPDFYQQPQSPLAGQDPRRRAAGRQQAAPELEA